MCSWRTIKRNIYADLMEGVADMKSHREGKITLRSYKANSVRFYQRTKVSANCRDGGAYEKPEHENVSGTSAAAK
jgi:hypothetical protein